MPVVVLYQGQNPNCWVGGYISCSLGNTQGFWVHISCHRGVLIQGQQNWFLPVQEAASTEDQLFLPDGFQLVPVLSSVVQRTSGMEMVIFFKHLHWA